MFAILSIIHYVVYYSIWFMALFGGIIYYLLGDENTFIFKELFDPVSKNGPNGFSIIMMLSLCFGVIPIVPIPIAIIIGFFSSLPYLRQLIQSQIKKDSNEQ